MSLMRYHNTLDRQSMEEVRESLKASGSVRSTLGLTKPDKALDNYQGPLPYLDSLSTEMKKANPTDTYRDFDEDGGAYSDRRFGFIAAEEGYRDQVYDDINGYKTVGYGFNMDAPSNRKLFQEVLGDKRWDSVYSGKERLKKTEARRLFDASVQQAERVVDNKFSDTPLKEHQRIALVSLAYNNPSLIGPNLTRQVQNGEWDKARDEILYKSNRNKVKGLASRRYREANMFVGHGDAQASLPDYSKYIQKFL